MTEKKDKMINLKGANSTMKLGFLIYIEMRPNFFAQFCMLRQELTCISNIPIEYIDPYPGHPFYVENDEDIRGMYGKANDIRISF